MIWKATRISINKVMFFLLSLVDFIFKFCKDFLTIELAIRWTMAEDNETQPLIVMDKDYLIFSL